MTLKLEPNFAPFSLHPRGPTPPLQGPGNPCRMSTVMSGPPQSQHPQQLPPHSQMHPGGGGGPMPMSMLQVGPGGMQGPPQGAVPGLHYGLPLPPGYDRDHQVPMSVQQQLPGQLLHHHGPPIGAIPSVSGPLSHGPHHLHHPHGPLQMHRVPPIFGQPEYRIFELNKRLQQRADESDSQWWEAFVTDFFEDDATLTISVRLDNISKQFTIGRTLIPRYFRSIFESGCNELFFSLRHTRESFHSPILTLESDCASQVMNMARPFPTTVVVEGQLSLGFTVDDFMRIRTWLFHIRTHRELILRSMLGIQDPNLLEQASKNVTRSGLTASTLHFLRLCVILEPMQELMSRQKSHSLSPRECLRSTLYQRWVRMNNPQNQPPKPEPNRQPSKRRKRKGSSANPEVGSGGGRVSKRKQSPVPVPSQSLAQPGDIMIVGEPTLMGGDFGEDDERLITRLENTQYDAQAAAAAIAAQQQQQMAQSGGMPPGGFGGNGPPMPPTFTRGTGGPSFVGSGPMMGGPMMGPGGPMMTSPNCQSPMYPGGAFGGPPLTGMPPYSPGGQPMKQSPGHYGHPNSVPMSQGSGAPLPGSYMGLGPHGMPSNVPPHSQPTKMLSPNHSLTPSSSANTMMLAPPSLPGPECSQSGVCGPSSQPPRSSSASSVLIGGAGGGLSCHSPVSSRIPCYSTDASIDGVTPPPNNNNGAPIFLTNQKSPINNSPSEPYSSSVQFPMIMMNRPLSPKNRQLPVQLQQTGAPLSTNSLAMRDGSGPSSVGRPDSCSDAPGGNNNNNGFPICLPLPGSAVGDVGPPKPPQQLQSPHSNQNAPNGGILSHDFTELETGFLPPSTVESKSNDVPPPPQHPLAPFSNLPPPDLLASMSVNQQPPQLTNDVTVDEMSLPSLKLENSATHPNVGEAEPVLETYLNNTTNNSPVVDS